MKRVAVLGAGIMGAGIAQVAAEGGYEVILRDLQMSLVNEGIKTITRNLENAIKKGRIDLEKKCEVLERIHGTTDLAELNRADLVIEAVIENMAIKKQIFTELDNKCGPDTILGTNTSSLSITEIASVTRHKERVLGMHFFNPVPSMKLVELVRGLETSDKTVNVARHFAANVGKDPIVVNRENPGFIVNRILVPYLNEAITAYGEGLASREEIDKAMKLGAGMPMGPLELADMIGLDTLYAIVLVFYEEFKDPKYRPHPVFATMVRAGYYGRKSGKGFYDYDVD